MRLAAARPARHDQQRQGLRVRQHRALALVQLPQLLRLIVAVRRFIIIAVKPPAPGKALTRIQLLLQRRRQR